MSEADALDLLTTLSLIRRRLDTTRPSLGAGIEWSAVHRARPCLVRRLAGVPCTPAIAKEVHLSPHSGSTSFQTSVFVTPEVARDDSRVLLLRLRELRGTRSLEEVSTAVGIRADELSRIERGLTKQVRWDTLLRLLVTYHCQPDDLLQVEYEVANPSDNPREAMLAAMQAGVVAPVPPRRLNIREDNLEPNAEASRALAEPVKRGVVRRKFKPAGAS